MSSSTVATSSATTTTTSTVSGSGSSGNTADGVSSNNNNNRIKSPYFDISQLPSLKKDGMTIQQEAMQRRKTCRFIEEAGRIIKLPRVAIATAMVMFHRFYAKHAFSDHDRFEVAVACIVLAAKTEESPKKLNTVITECHKLKIQGIKNGRISSTPSSNATTTTTTTNKSSSNILTNNNIPNENLDIKSEEFLKLKERVLLLERVILHTIGFELSIDHPYKFLVDQIRTLITKQQIEFVPPSTATIASTTNETTSTETTAEMNKKMMNRLVQMSMNFANDSMHTSLCLQFDPKQIAIACVYLGCQFAKIQPSTGYDWIEILFDIYPNHIEDLASISLQILELIAERKGSDTIIIETIRKYLDTLLKSSSSTATTTNSDTTSKKEDNNTTTNNTHMKKESSLVQPPQPDAKRQRMG